MVSYYRAFAPKSEAVNCWDNRATLNLRMRSTKSCLPGQRYLRIWFGSSSATTSGPMALPRYLYSITKTSREPLVARRKDGGRQAELEEEFELEQSTSSNIPCNKREVFANDTPSGESTEIYSAASQGCTVTIRSSVDTIGKAVSYVELLRC